MIGWVRDMKEASEQLHYEKEMADKRKENIYYVNNNKEELIGNFPNEWVSIKDGHWHTVSNNLDVVIGKMEMSQELTNDTVFVFCGEYNYYTVGLV